MDTREFNEIIAANSSWISALRTEVGKVVIGQQALVDRLILSLLCKGHVLLEGVPGLAKTLSVKAMAGTLHAQFARIQFTPDLLPADLLGTMIYNPEERQFTAKKGPIFANLILADEINRAPAKVQSALLEAMQERQVTLGETTYRLPDPFLVLATQNPIDQEGTYQLPEAQLDRFLFKVLVTYPTREEELQVLDLMASSAKPPETSPVTTPEQVAASRDLVNQIYIDDAVRGFRERIAERGLIDGKNVSIELQNAHGDVATLQAIATQFVSAGCDLIFAVSTPAVQACARATKTIPIVATAVTDFERAKVIRSNEKPGGNVSGVSNIGPVDKQLELLLGLLKGREKEKTIGTIYTASEDNSLQQVERMKKAADALGVEVVEITISSVNDLQQAAASLASKVGGIWIPTDNTIASGSPILAKAWLPDLPVS